MAEDLIRRVNQYAVVSAVHAEGGDRGMWARQAAGASLASAGVPEAMPLGIGGDDRAVVWPNLILWAGYAAAAAQGEATETAVTGVVVLRMCRQKAIQLCG